MAAVRLGPVNEPKTWAYRAPTQSRKRSPMQIFKRTCNLIEYTFTHFTICK